MKHTVRAGKKLGLNNERGPVDIGISITNQRGERLCRRASAVSLRMGCGVIQLIERERGCFVWFRRCNVEVRDGRRNLLFRLLSGSASSDGANLTIVAEVASQSGGAAACARLASGSARTPTGSGGGLGVLCPEGGRRNCVCSVMLRL
ncbi:MAG: hypothetical protein Q7S40_07025 [Opitutaceae bacterium]|nr:hypothetical protein [Opitutaceae bacterium]